MKVKGMKVKVKSAAAVLLAALLPCGGAPTATGQIFNDPLHQVSNFMQFVNSIDAAIQSVEGLEKIWNTGAETAEHLKKVKELTSIVSSELMKMRDVEEAIRDLVEMTDMVTALANQVKKSSSVLSFEETTAALDIFAATLTRATRNLKTIYDYGSDKWKMVDAERKAAIEREKEKIEAEKGALKRFKEIMDELMKRRGEKKTIIDAYSDGKFNRLAISPGDISFMFATMEDDASIDDLVAAASGILGDEKKAGESVETSISKVGGVAGYFFDIYYSICAVAGLIGAYRVYSRVMQGEELGKAIWSWLGAALLGFFMGVLVQGFFFT
jgi:hypothetical protein